ncbi:hypothetical protein N431DRAFT_128493 [Stipitochalara longipes BDJ]|nr:hypothetical protein N431DRAFT_128493 [Stipitochalara longipes BDJ]
MKRARVVLWANFPFVGLYFASDDGPRRDIDSKELRRSEAIVVFLYLLIPKAERAMSGRRRWFENNFSANRSFLCFHAPISLDTRSSRISAKSSNSLHSSRQLIKSSPRSCTILASQR